MPLERKRFTLEYPARENDQLTFVKGETNWPGMITSIEGQKEKVDLFRVQALTCPCIQQPRFYSKRNTR